MDHEVTRRDFLKLGGLGLMAVVASNIKVPSLNEAERPVLVHGLEVYGTRGEIKNQEDFDKLYSHLNDTFAVNLPLLAGFASPPEQRDIFWGRDKRALEIIVRKSAFEKDPISDDFSLRMKRQVEYMNRVSKSSTPPIDVEIKLARIIVVDNSFNFDIHPAGFKYALDVDHSELIGNEPEDQYLCRIDANEDQSLKVVHLAGDQEVGDTYLLPEDKDSLSGAKNVRLSYYLTHELWHRVVNVFDLSTMEIRKNTTGNFLFRSWTIEENLNSPDLSPFTVHLANWQVNRGVRGYFNHPLSSGPSQEGITRMFKEVPNEVKITVKGAEQIGIFKTRMEGGYYWSKNADSVDKHLPELPDQTVDKEEIIIDKKLFESTVWREQKYVENEIPRRDGHDIEIVPTVYVLRAQKDGKTKELHLPVGIFVLSKIYGGLSKAEYEIDFVDQKPGDYSSESLRGDFVNTSQLSGYIEKIKNKGGSIYATMKIDGTDATFVWFQQDKRTVIPESKSATPMIFNTVGRFEGRTSSEEEKSPDTNIQP